MIKSIILFLLCTESKCYSYIYTLSQITNLTLSFKKTVTKPYTISPLIILPNTLINSQLTIANSRFLKIPFPVIQGFSKPLKIYQSKFSFCNTPIHLTGSMQNSIFNRSSYSNNIATIENTEYIFCFSHSSDGGCIYLSHCKFTIQTCSFIQNSALSGGAIYSSSGKLKIDQSNFLKNNATEKGGAIFLSNTTLVMDHCQIAFNTANKKGGAIYSKECLYENFINNNFHNNLATKKYGALFLNNCYGIIISCFFRNNKANESNIGLSLAVIKNNEQLNIESCAFFDTSPYQIMISTSSVSIFCDSSMSASESDAIYILNQSSKISYYIVNVVYNAKKMPSQPKVPEQLVYDFVIYNEKSPPLEWNFIIISLITIIFIFGGLVEWILPIVIWPNFKEKKGYVRQN